MDAALTCFSRDGYGGATTAAICRQAGIGSETFFHYFPTKLAVLLVLLELGTRETEEWFTIQEGRTDAAGVVDDYVGHLAEESADPRVAGFVRAVGAVMAEPEVVAALASDEDSVRRGLLPWVRRAIAAGEVRSDLGAERVVAWVQALLDGYLSRISVDESFNAVREHEALLDAVRRLLRP